MARFTIYSIDGAVRYSGSPQYNGSYMGVDYIEFRSISSPAPINWERGDFVDYYRTGLRYRLYSIPEPGKVARRGEYGGSFEYSNVQFHAATKELEIAPFRDLVPRDNRIHFSTRPDVSTYEDVYGIARRVQECMNDLFPNRWRIEVVETEDESLLSLLHEVKEYSVSNGSCLDALAQIYDLWKNVGWIHTYDAANDVDVITIGRANVRDSENTSDAFAYGKDNGLTSIKKLAANKDEFATRLYVYGSDRNIQTRYYNGKDIVDKDSVDIRNLMLPIESWGKTDGLPDARKAFLQADDAIVAKYGLIPRTVYFDGSEREEIYPSIIGLTERKVRTAMIESGNGGSPLLPPDTDERIDKVLGCSQPYDNGDRDSVEATPTFMLAIRQLGFDLHEQGKLTDAGHAVISMKSGDCAGREFVVKSFDGSSRYPNIVLERYWDDSLGMGFPNGIYRIKPEDEFVILDIPMPEYYISINEDKLLEAGEKLLADYTRVSAFYEPSINPIKIKDSGKPLHPGMYMQVYDKDIIDTKDNVDYVLIDTLSIDEASELPQYKVTLREEKRSARTFSALADMIEDAKEVTKDDIKQVRQYTDRRFRSSQETLDMLQKAISGFTDSISPITVKTMSMLVGDESLQFKFTAARNSLAEIPCPISWNESTHQIKAISSALVHMTMGIKDISNEITRSVEDYSRWSIPAQNSEVLDDSDARYVYVRASKSGTSGSYILSKDAIAMEQESGYYHFLVGVLSSSYDGTRDFVTVYGFTEVLPGQIATDVIRSGNGKLVIDLANALITAKDGAKISGDITIGSGSSGLTNLSEWSDKQKQIDDAQAAADNTQKALEETAEQLGKSIQEVAEIVDSVDAATKTLDTRIADVETGVNESVAEINARLDGVVENYFEEGVPTLTNYPASEWIDENEKKNHIGDTYTNISSYDKDPDNAGKSWRWTHTDSEHTGYHWHPIADSDAVKALLEASKAKTTADGKSKTFVTQPVPPYKEGDLWVQGASGDIYRCKDGVDRTSGSYTASDWELASKYTDDTKADQAIEDAADAMDAAEKAQEVADAAKKVTDALNDDGIFTLVEKRGIRNALKEINPSEEDHVITRYYELTAVTNAGTGSWSEITDKADEDYGWYVSDMHSHNAYAIAKVTFNVLADCSVTMRIKAKSETQYDYVMLGDLDGTQLSTPTYTSSDIVANTMGKAAGEEVQHTFHGVEKGEHSVYVYYRKNLFTSEEPDNGYFRLDASPYLRGSLGDYLALCEKKGISGGNAEYYANDLFFSMYHTYKVWENNDSDLSSFEGYRDQMMMLFQYYYSSILEIQQSITQSDYDYLTQVFGKGNNLNVEGVVMSQMVAVRSEEDKVKAFLNGSNLGRNSEHGKLLIGAGVDDITKPEETKTRIYEDGTIISPLIKMLDGCRIGEKSIRIEDDQIVIDLAGNGMKMTLSEQGLVTEGYSSATVGNCGGAALQGFANGVYAFCPANTNPIGVQGEAKSGDYAFYSSSGMFAGLRPKTRVISNTANATSRHKLNEFDYSVLVRVASGTCYISLPDNPLDGQEYMIESRGAELNIVASRPIFSTYSGTMFEAGTAVTQTGRSLLRFKFYGSAGTNGEWNVTWISRNN